MWGKGNASPVLVGVHTCTGTLEINMVVSPKIGNQSTSKPSNTTTGHIPKRCFTILQGHLLNYVHSTFICNDQKLDLLYIFPSNEEDLVYLHMDYYSAVKNNDIGKSAGKWMELEKIILSEVTQTQKEKRGMYSLKSGY